MLHRITNAHLHAPEDLGLCHLLIAAGQIVAIDRDAPIQIDSRLLASDIDLESRRLIPGLIDYHTHTTGGGGEAGFATRVPPVPLSRFTTAGVTSVVGLLGTDDLTRSTSSLIAQTMALREEGLSAWCYTGGYHLPPTTLTGSVRSDIVHIDCIIAVGELAISDHRSSQPTLIELMKVASEAHVAGLMTGKAGIVHLHLGDGERGLSLIREALSESELPARVFNPTHVNRRRALFEEACELTAQGCVIDLTAFPVAEGEDAWSASDGLARYLDAGLPFDQVTISSDGGGCLPVFDDQGELESLDYGTSQSMTDCLTELLSTGRPMGDILPAFTRNQARLLKLHRKGRIEVGMDADLVVLDETHRVRDVMALGQWHVREGQLIRQGTFENQPLAPT